MYIIIFPAYVIIFYLTFSLSDDCAIIMKQ